MTSLNVYKHYGLSIPEIFQAGTLVVSPREAEESVQKAPAKKSFLKPFIVSALVFCIAAGVGLYIINPFKEAENTPIRVFMPPPPEPIDPYVQIHIIDFEGEPYVAEVLPQITSGEPIVSSLSPNTKPVEQPKPEIKPKPESPAPQLVKPSSKPATIPLISMYAINAEGLNLRDRDSIAEAAQGIAKVNSQKVSLKSRYWVVYVPKAGTKIFVEGTEVNIAGFFTSREEAMVLARTNADMGETSFLKYEDLILESFNVTICCMNLDTAKFIARKSGITDKVINIIRQ